MMKHNKKGSAMIVVLCIMAILMTLSFALLLSASIVVANANRRKQQEQCKISASSFGKNIEADLKDESIVEKEGSLRAYLRDEIERYMRSQNLGWAYYNEDEGDAHSMAAAKRTFSMEEASWKNQTGTLKMEAYWESEYRYADIFFVFTVEANIKKESYKRQIKYQLNIMKPEEYMEKYPDKGKPDQDVWLWKREGIQ